MEKENRRIEHIGKAVGKVYYKMGIAVILIGMVIFLSIVSPTFLTTTNLINILRQISFTAIIGFGVTFVLISKGMDLSSGAVVSLTSVICASFAHPGTPVIVSLAVGLLVGAVCGFINGFIIAKAKIPPFIVTMGMMTVAEGAALLFSNGRPVNNLSDAFVYLGAGRIGVIPVPIIILALMAAACAVLLNKTTFGKHVRAIGGNENAALLSGIQVTRIKIITYLLAGMMSALAGMILTARIYSGQPALGDGMQMDAIAAAVIGGTSLNGGIGTIVGTIGGALVIGIINNGMDLLNINMYWQQIAKGIIIVAAVILDNMKHNER